MKERVLSKIVGGNDSNKKQYFFVIDCVNKDGIFLQQASDLYPTSDDADNALNERKKNLIKLGYEVLSVKQTCVSRG